MRYYGSISEDIKAFYLSHELAMKVYIPENSYSSPQSAACSYRSAIRSMRYPIAARILNGDLYLIKVSPAKQYTRSNKICKACPVRYPNKQCKTCTRNKEG